MDIEILENCIIVFFVSCKGNIWMKSKKESR